MEKDSGKTHQENPGSTRKSKFFGAAVVIDPKKQKQITSMTSVIEVILR